MCKEGTQKDPETSQTRVSEEEDFPQVHMCRNALNGNAKGNVNTILGFRTARLGQKFSACSNKNGVTELHT